MKVRLAAACAAVVLLAGCSSQSTPTVSPAEMSSLIAEAAGTTTSDDAPVLVEHQVTYAVGGGFATFGNADVTMEAPTGTVQKTITSIGNAGVYSFSSGSFLYLSVQNATAYGSVSCTIWVDGVVVSTNTSVGAYVIAACKGTV